MAVPADPDRAPRLPWTTAVVLVVLAGNLVLSVRRALDDRARAAFVGLNLNVLLLYYATRHFELAPPGSAVRGRARLAVWLLAATLMAGFTWKVSTMVPRGLAILCWLVDAATQLASFRRMFVHGRE